MTKRRNAAAFALEVVAVILTPYGPAYGQWDPAGYYEIERQTYQTPNSQNLPRGAVMSFNRDMVTEQIGNVVYVHIVYASCPVSTAATRLLILSSRGPRRTTSRPAAWI